MKNYYVTTPIYYVNDKPHIGHAYTTILADVLARFHRLNGDHTWFLTGTDEHGQKVEKAAQKNQMKPIEQCDTTVIRFQSLWKRLNISNDDFIRTTEERHKKVVQKVLQDLFDRQLIYRAEYTGCYCVPCERFFTEKDLLEGGLCPECKRPTDSIIESNYFFKMSAYQDWLIDYIQTHEDFIQPAFRANETLGFLKQPLNDLCISRPKSRLNWGIELPFDHDYVCYVWFDALINYISALGYESADNSKFQTFWEDCTHLIGKDILTTHTVYWPTMLKAMNLPLPKAIFAHGWWLTSGEKMSKSIGNVVDPMQLCDQHGVDAFRYYLMAEMIPGQDASFTTQNFITRYNSDLANDLGNLLSRIAKMIGKQFNGKMPKAGVLENVDLEFINEVEQALKQMPVHFENMKINLALDAILTAVRAGNRYMEKTAPWVLAKEGNMSRLGTVLKTSAEGLRMLCSALHIVMPEKMREVLRILGVEKTDITQADLLTWDLIKEGANVDDVGILFPRIEIEKNVEIKAPKVEKVLCPKKEEKIVGIVTIDEVKKLDLRTAKILSGERVEGAQKLLKLQIQIGEEKRQIIAGIAMSYSIEQLIGKTIVVVANLQKATIRGIESQGMLLAAKSGDQLSLITTDLEMVSGSSVG